MKTKPLKNVIAALFATTAIALGQPKPGTVLWSYPIYSPGSPALGPDGTIYLGGPVLTAITNAGTHGTNKWTFSGASGGVGVPAVGTDGTIYFASDKLYAVNPDGTLKWAYRFQGEAYSSSPAIGWDGTVYVQADSNLLAVTSSGTKEWSYPLSGNNQGSPVVGSDGTIYVGNGTGLTLYAINPDGSLKWSYPFQTGYVVGDSPALGADSTIYVSSGVMYALNRNGAKLWSTADPAGLPVIGKDGMIYAAYSDSLYSITPSGDLRLFASFQTCGFKGCNSGQFAAINGAGIIYYCESNSVFALSPQGQVEWVVSGVEQPYLFPTTCPVIAPDGTIYAALGTRLYAIAGMNALANSPWPMYRQNARHTGKVEKPALQQPQKRSDANFQFQLYGDIGQTYTVESSTNLFDWTSLTSFVATTLPMDVVDFSATNFPARFYRASSPP